MKSLPLLIVALGLAVAPALAQDKPADTNALVRAKLQTDKKLLIAANMDLTESEAKGFWPVYDAYQADLQKANDRIKGVIVEYAGVYRDEAKSDQQALNLVDEKIAIEEAEVQRDRSYVPKLSAVLPPRKVMRYLQLESKVRAIVRYELADRIPIIE